MKPRARPARRWPGSSVLDLGTVIAGAYAGGILANFGADVVKIEPAEGDPFRSDGGGFMAYNRGKRGLGLDLKEPEAGRLFSTSRARPTWCSTTTGFGVRKRLGIDYAALRAINPRIVSCSINAYGDRGRARDPAGLRPLLQAEGGMMAAQGGGDEPIFHTVAVNDVATAAVAAFGVIAALNARERHRPRPGDRDQPHRPEPDSSPARW